MAFPKDILREHKELDDLCILHGYRGSISHGMFVPSSDPNSIDDKDTMAVCIPDLNYYFGLKHMDVKEIKRGEWDIVIYELRHFVSLLSKGNPNVLSLLWLEDNLFIKKTEIGQMLIDSRDLFIGKHAFKSFTGYAYSQLKKMENGAFKGYMGEKRKSLVEKYGYDTKNASHLIRLLRMCIEFLNDGRLYVLREDATQLIDIKKGAWPLEKVKEEADRLFKLADQAYLHSRLPVSADKDKINELLVRMLNKKFNLRVGFEVP